MSPQNDTFTDRVKPELVGHSIGYTGPGVVNRNMSPDLSPTNRNWSPPAPELIDTQHKLVASR